MSSTENLVRDTLLCMESSRSSRGSDRAFSLPLLLGVGVLCVTGLSAARELYRREQVRTDLQTLEQRVQALQDRKMEVSQILQRLQTPEVIDREARLRLNMQKPGERVYILRGEEWEQQQAPATADLPTLYKDTVVEPARSNPERWLRYFFVHSSS